MQDARDVRAVFDGIRRLEDYFRHVAQLEPRAKLPGVPLRLAVAGSGPIEDELHERYGSDPAVSFLGKLDFPAYTNGTLLNMWISQSELIEQS